MSPGDIVIMEFQCAGMTSTENQIVKEVIENEIIIMETFQSTEDEENYRFDRKTGKCLNAPNFGFNSKRTLQV